MRRRYGLPGASGLPINARTIKLVVGGLAALLAGVLVTKHPQVSPEKASPMGSELHRVVYVYDGDTVKLDNDERVRFIGIDTPESHDNPKLERDIKKLGKGRQELLAMGRKAAIFTKALLENQQVRVETDVEPRDRYGRLLGYLYLSDGTFVNERIIRAGYAYPLTIPPNVRHATEFKHWFDEAREDRRGLWQ